MIAELKNVTKAYRTGDTKLSVLDKCDFAVAPGETVAIVGPSGSG